MPDTKQVTAELSDRIDSDIKFFGGSLPERTTIAWRGYLAAVLEWNVISNSQYEMLLALLPPTDDDPAIAILRGRE